MTTYRLSSPLGPPPLRRRASGLAVALGVNLLLLLALIGIGRLVPIAMTPSRATIVDLIPESHDAAEPTARREPERKAVARPARPKLAPVPRIAIPRTPPAARPLPWIELSSAEMATADLKNATQAGTGSGAPGDSEEVGRGPHGEVLYAAEWARRPTDAELGGYLPRNAPDGWGMIACRTMPDNRVDDCIELGQSPGSRLASAVRQAAWQFRVRPPRRNGKPLIGEWVRIRIDYEFSGG